MNTKSLTKKLFISTYAVEVCRYLNEIDVKHCCGCIQNRNTQCLMLSEDEKIEVHFDRAFRTVSVEKVIGKVMDLIKPFQLTIEIEAELYNWMENDLIFKEYQKIKDMVKIIRMY